MRLLLRCVSGVSAYGLCFSYGFLNQFRPQPLIPNQVYRFDPTTSRVKVVADGFDKCNGIAFSEDGQTAFV